jgi:hypothetical protein
MAEVEWSTGEFTGYIHRMPRLVIPLVEVTAPDGTKSLWAAVSIPHKKAVAAVKELIPANYTAELSIRRPPPGKIEGFRRGGGGVWKLD